MEGGEGGLWNKTRHLPAVFLLGRGLGLHHAALPASHPVVVVVFAGVEWAGWVRSGRVQCGVRLEHPEELAIR